MGESIYLDVARACDRWLKKHVPEYRPGAGWNKSRFERPQDHTPASTNKGNIRVERDKPKPVYKQPYKYRKRNRAKYKTEEERKAAISAAVKARWAEMTAAKRAERIQKIQASRPKKQTIPRHLRPEWKAYKLAWYRANYKPLTDPVKIQKRRDAAKARYHAKDPAVRAAEHKIRRERYFAKKRAEKEKAIQVA